MTMEMSECDLCGKLRSEDMIAIIHVLNNAWKVCNHCSMDKTGDYIIRNGVINSMVMYRMHRLIETIINE